MLCLSVPDEKSIKDFMVKLDGEKIRYTPFFEPDVNEITSLCIEPCVQTKRLCKNLPLAGKEFVPPVQELIRDMENTFQFEGRNMLEHGRHVFKYSNKVITALKAGESSDLKVPDIFFEYSNFLLSNLHSDDIMRNYTIWHDCGKPYCRTVDENGKQHFKNHAKISSTTFAKYFSEHPNKDIICRLIESDMDIHLLKDDGIQEFLKKDVKDICTHLIVGLAEILSNCQMFGGYESDGFKIKYKALQQRAKKILKSLQE